MSTDLVIPDLASITTAELNRHPGLIADAIDVAQQLARTAALMQRWPEMERAIDALIERQKLIVSWWVESVRPAGPDRGERTSFTAVEAERMLGVGKRRISDYRRALATPDYRLKLIMRARKAALREPEDPSATRATPARDGPDFWPTPVSLIDAMTTHLLPRLPPGPVWECACGDGRLAEAMERAGRQVWQSDRWPPPGVLARDFLTSLPPADPSVLVITNPPFNLASPFIARGLALLDQRLIGGLVLLLRHDHLAALGRVDVLNRATVELHCNWRPLWIDDSEGAPRWSFAWVTWLPVPTRAPPVYLASAEGHEASP